MSSLTKVQIWDAGKYAKNARFVATHGAEILSWLSPQAGERILDVGCGDGVLTEDLVKAGATVVGVDLSEQLLAAASARGLDVRRADVRALPFEAEFDAVFSNAVLHWVPEPGEAAASIHKALKPGGRFVAEFGGHCNVATIVTGLRAAALRFGGDPALVAPWFYPTPAEYRIILERAGFKVQRIELVPRLTALPTGIEGWLDTFRKPFFDQFGSDKRQEVLSFVVDLLRPALCDTAGNWTADYVRLRVSAVA